MTIEEYNAIAHDPDVMKIMHEVFARPIEGQVIKHPFDAKGIWLMVGYQTLENGETRANVFNRDKAFDTTSTLFEDEAKYGTYVPKSIFSEYVYTLLMNHIAKHPGCMSVFSDYNRKPQDCDYRLMALLDTFYLPKVLKSSNPDECIASVRAALDKSCRKRALNQHGYSLVMSYVASDEEKEYHREHISAEVKRLLDDFSDIRESIKRRFRDDLK